MGLAAAAAANCDRAGAEVSRASRGNRSGSGIEEDREDSLELAVKNRENTH